MSAFVVILILWLDPDGSITAHASGVAVDDAACRATATQNVESERATNPELRGKTPVVMCLDTHKYARPSAPAPVDPHNKFKSDQRSSQDL